MSEEISGQVSAGTGLEVFLELVIRTRGDPVTREKDGHLGLIIRVLSTVRITRNSCGVYKSDKLSSQILRLEVRKSAFHNDVEIGVVSLATSV